MTSTTSQLGLTTYNIISDGSSLTATYINQASGSATNANLPIVDRFAVAVTASLVALSGSANNTSASLTWISGSLTVVTTFATQAEVSSASTINHPISASSLGSSDYGKRAVFIPINQTISLVSTDTAYVRIPDSMSGWKLISAVATCSTSTSGNPAFKVMACPKTAFTGSQSMLSTMIQVGSGVYDSSAGTGSVAGVVNQAYSVVTAGDKVWVSPYSASTCGSTVSWAGVTLTFQRGR